MVTLTQDELFGLERDGWNALSHATGAAFYGDLMTADAVMILVNGSVLDRDAVVASLDEAPPWTSFTLADERVVEVGEDAAALVYRASAERDGTTFEALMTSVYRRVEGRTRLALYQQTAIPARPES